MRMRGAVGQLVILTRKHSTSEGELRRNIKRTHAHLDSSPKAPSTRRCIKTVTAPRSSSSTSGQKAPSTTRCIKTVGYMGKGVQTFMSESTQHQQAYRWDLQVHPHLLNEMSDQAARRRKRS